MLNNKRALSDLLTAIGKKMFSNVSNVRITEDMAKGIRNSVAGLSLTAIPALGYMYAEDEAKRKNQELEALLALRQGEPLTNLDFSSAPGKEEEPLYMDLVADAISSRVMEKLAAMPNFKKSAATVNPTDGTIKALTQAALAALVGMPLMGKVGMELGQYMHPKLEDELGSLPISKNITVS